METETLQFLDKVQDGIREIEQNHRDIQKNLGIFRELLRKEANKIDFSIKVQGIVKLVKDLIKKLDRRDYPMDGICSHHGVQKAIYDEAISISNTEAGKLLITVYGKSYIQCDEKNNWVKFGKTHAEHDIILKTVSAALNRKILEFWNGEEGDAGISFVLDRKCPKSLLTAITNYNNLPNVFNITSEHEKCYEKFNEWLNK